jgi:hypothetical protein
VRDAVKSVRKGETGTGGETEKELLPKKIVSISPGVSLSPFLTLFLADGSN